MLLTGLLLDRHRKFHTLTRLLFAYATLSMGGFALAVQTGGAGCAPSSTACAHPLQLLGTFPVPLDVSRRCEPPLSCCCVRTPDCAVRPRRA